VRLDGQEVVLGVGRVLEAQTTAPRGRGHAHRGERSRSPEATATSHTVGLVRQDVAAVGFITLATPHTARLRSAIRFDHGGSGSANGRRAVCATTGLASHFELAGQSLPFAHRIVAVLGGGIASTTHTGISSRTTAGHHAHEVGSAPRAARNGTAACLGLVECADIDARGDFRGLASSGVGIHRAVGAK